MYSYQGNTGFSIHHLGEEGTLLSSETDSAVFRGIEYAHYAIPIGEDRMVEVAATSSGLLLVDQAVNVCEVAVSGLQGAHVVQLATPAGRVLYSKAWVFR